MHSLKTLVVVGVLAIIGYALYQGLNNGFQFEPPPMPDGWENEVSDASGIPSVNPGTQQTIESTPGTAPPIGVMPAPGAAPLNPPYADPATSISTSADSLPPTTLSANQGDGDSGGPAAGQGALPPGVTSLGPAAGTLSPSTPGPSAGAAGPSNVPTAPYDQLPPTSTTQSPSTTGDRYGDYPPANQNTTNQDTSPSATATPNQAPSATSSTNAAFGVAMSTANDQLNRGQMDQALMTLSLWYEKAGLSDQEQEQLTALLDQVAGTVIYSQKHLLEAAYQVRPGDRLDDIARNYKVPPGLLVKINGIRDANNLTPGQELKVIRGPFNAQINTTSGVLTLFLGGYYGGRFKVHTGPEFDGIVGSFVVTSKNRAHTSFGGHPWIELGQGYASAAGSPSGAPSISIVGMDLPSQVANGTSQGQIGVSVQDADDLFDILSQGSKVTIIR